MPGKNQNKRLRKSFTHAELVWTRERLSAATFRANLQRAKQVVEERKQELTDEDYAEIEAQIFEQEAFIDSFLEESYKKYLRKLEELERKLHP